MRAKREIRMRKLTRRALARRGLSAGILAAGLAPEMLTSRLAHAQTPAKPAVAPKKGGTLNTILTPEPPVLVLGVNNQGPTAIAPASCTRACASIPLTCS